MRWMIKVFFALILIEDAVTEIKSSYCGTKLTKILQQYCMAYPPHPSEHHRTKRQIIQECCINQCTLTYLLNNYCQTINTAAMERTTMEAILPRERRLSKTYLPQNIEEKRPTRRIKKRRRRKRGKRNCTCKKGLKKKVKRHQLEERMRSRGPIQESRVGHIEDHSTAYFIHKI